MLLRTNVTCALQTVHYTAFNCCMKKLLAQNHESLFKGHYFSKIQKSEFGLVLLLELLLMLLLQLLLLQLKLLPLLLMFIHKHKNVFGVMSKVNRKKNWLDKSSSPS